MVQLKADYKIVKTLRGLSGFGWDKGQQMVTAPAAVWENYVQVCLCCSERDILTVCFTQSHEKAKKFMTWPFLLYDDIAELTDRIASICKVIPTLRYLQVMKSCILKDTPIRGTPLPSTEHVAKLHFEVCGCQDIL